MCVGVHSAELLKWAQIKRDEIEARYHLTCEMLPKTASEVRNGDETSSWNRVAFLTKTVRDSCSGFSSNCTCTTRGAVTTS